MKRFGLKNWVWLFIGVVIVSCMFTLMYSSSHHYLTDAEFHANRVYQMLTCISNDMPLWFYYNDVNELGYGNSFFYGWLTLIPFMPVLKYLGVHAFIDLYRLFAYALCFVGVCYFVKRYIRDNYMLIGCIIISQPLFWGYMFAASTYPNVLGAGLCLIFFALCVDFFRDNKSFIPACLVYFLIFNTHIISTIFGFIGCAVLCVVYFNKKRFKEYICFGCICFAFCFWNVVQVLYYFECFSSNGSRVSAGLISKSLDMFNGYCFSILSCFGILCPVFGGACPVSSISSTLAVIYGILRRKKNIREIVCICIVVSIFILSFESVFVKLNEITDYKTVIQFPSRVFIYLIVLMAIIGFRNFSYNKLILLLLCNLSIFGVALSTIGNFLDMSDKLIICDFYGDDFLTWAGDSDSMLFNQVGNGEYFPTNYEFSGYYPKDKGVFDSSNIHYLGSYNEGTGIYSADLAENKSDIVRINRLWYKGYVSNAGECFQYEDGFVGVDVSGFTGSLEVWYEYPLLLRFAFIVSYLFIGLVIVRFMYRRLFGYASM